MYTARGRMGNNKCRSSNVMMYLTQINTILTQKSYPSAECYFCKELYSLSNSSSSLVWLHVVDAALFYVDSSLCKQHNKRFHWSSAETTPKIDSLQSFRGWFGKRKGPQPEVFLQQVHLWGAQLNPKSHKLEIRTQNTQQQTL